MRARFRSVSLAVVAAVAAAVLVGPLPSGAGRALVPDALAQDATAAAEDREWNQAGGGSTHSGWSAAVPIRATPVVAWRQKLPGKLATDPVAWGGVVYVVAANKKGRDLYAYRASTGERIGWRQLGEGGPTTLGVWQGTAVVAEPNRVRGYALRSDGFATGWAQSDNDLGPLAIVRGVALAAKRSAVVALNAQTGKVLGTFPQYAYEPGPVLALPRDGGFTIAVPLAGTQTGYMGEFLGCEYTVVSGDARKGLTVTGSWEMVSNLTVRGAIDRDCWAAWFASPRTQVTTDVRSARHSGMLLVCGGPKFPTAKNELLPGGGVAPKDEWPTRIGTRPAAMQDRVYGFSPEGELIAMDFDGRYYVLVERGHLPAGARPGPATIAQNVACFGNWAVDVETRRVLWCLPDLRPASQAVPVTDGRIVVATDADEVVCLADPLVVAAPAPAAAPTAGAPAKPGVTPSASGPKSAAPPSRARAPSDLEGVLLADGTRIDGTAEVAEGGAIRVTPAAGDARTFPADAVSVAIAGGALLHRGEEFGALAAWRDAIEDEAVDAYSDLFRKAAAESLVETSRGFLAKARKFGIDDARAEQLDRLLTGKNEHPNAKLKVPRFAAMESEALLKLEARTLEASAWLGDRGMPTAATAVLAIASRTAPARPAIYERAAALVPEAFPFAPSPQRGRLWIEWAVEIGPAGGTFVSKDDPAWVRVSREPAWKTATIALRTRHLLFFSRTSDPAIVGPCLRNGEGAVRALDVLLQDGKPHPVVSDGDRLEVRLHANKKDYMDERPPSGGGAMSWSAGYYSPSENVSRFYLPDAKENEAARGRTLFKVLAHELTHHYIEHRHVSGKRGGAATPGYWVVEGMARFVEDQAVEMGRRGLRFDDSTAESLDLASQLDAKGALLLPLGRFVDLSHALSYSLSTERTVEVKLRNTLSTYEISALDVFYNQAGSLCFWLMHRRGPEGRAALLSYLRAHYSGRTTPDGWRALGFADAAAMEREFRAFLAELRK